MGLPLRTPLLALALLLPRIAGATQLVALDMKPVGKVDGDLAMSLTPILVTELDRFDSVSVVTQFDVKALLEHEANKQALGCDDTSCMTDIAGALGAELLLVSTISRVGRNWVVALSLIAVQSSRVERRATGSAEGAASEASEAVSRAVNNLLRDGLPATVQGPDWLSRRGFAAVLAGFARAVDDPDREPQAMRRKVILDLIHTELDFDLEPKVAMLADAIDAGVAATRRGVVGASKPDQVDRHIRARGWWNSLKRDRLRVDEIRRRARERGTAPTARALRFEPPEPMRRPAPADIARYERAIVEPKERVRAAIAAVANSDAKPFAASWTAGRQRTAISKHKSLRAAAEKNGQRCELLPVFATEPDLLFNAIHALDNDARVVVYVRYHRDQWQQTIGRVWLDSGAGTWRIRTWSN